jgi:hypothetical protein
MFGIAAHALDGDAVRTDQYAAANAAITTGGFDFLIHDFPSEWQLEQQICHP